MHTTVRSWRASRSGPRMTITGYVDGSQLVKLPAVSVQGPDATRLTLPGVTIAVQPDGTVIELA